METNSTLVSPNGMMHTAPLASPLAGAHARARNRIQNLVRFPMPNFEPSLYMHPALAIEYLTTVFIFASMLMVSVVAAAQEGG